MDSTPATVRPPDQTPPIQRPPNTPRKVFISYSRKDRNFAADLKRDLDNQEGMTAWMDTGIQGGKNWLKELAKGLKASTEVFLIASPHSKASSWVEIEVLAALKRKKPVTPLVHRRYGSWDLIGNLKPIDFRGRYDEAFVELMGCTPPLRTFWREVLILLAKIWDFRSLLTILVVALALGTAASVYFLSPSNTSISVSGSDESVLVVRVRNRGGRPSMLIGASFKLDFGSVPIKTEPLVLLQPEKYARIAGHSDVDVRFTAHNMLTPKKKGEDDDDYFSEKDIQSRLPGAKLILTAEVKESDDRLNRLSDEFPATGIQKFILEEFQNDPP